MALRPGQEVKAIYCNSSYGPTFGSSSGFDLYIVNGPNGSYCSTTLGNAYQLPPNCTGNTYLAGAQNFFVTELEVFGFQ